MKLRAILSLMVLLYISAAAQKSPMKFGEIPMADLQMKIYEEDSTAAAVILSDYGESYVSIYTGGGNYTFERHVRIKILKKEGLDWADVQIPLRYSGSDEEKVISLKASSYNLEGGKVVESKMSKDGVFKEKFSRYFNIQKFTIPNVREGSVIEYSYKVLSQFTNSFPNNWQFQFRIPVKRSEYWAILPDFFVFEKYMQGYIPSDNYTITNKNLGSYQASAHHWIFDNVPAFREEPFMTCENDYMARINFALSHIKWPGEPIQEIMGSWEKLNANLLESDGFGKAITGNGFLKKKVDEVTAGMTDPMQKLTAIYQYVRQNIEWDGTRDFEADPLKKVIESRKGTTGDINIALASMLEKAGIESDMILLSTRDHGFVRPQYPMTKQFNYVVCAARVNNTTFLLDATEKFLPINTLPARCLNGQGLVISKTRHGWFNLQTKTKARTVIETTLKLADTGELNGKIAFVHDGYDACDLRRTYVSKGEETYLKDFTKNRPWQIGRSEFKDVAFLDQTVKENHEITVSEHTSVAGDLMYLNPFIISKLETNPFLLEERLYPVDFGAPQEKVYSCKITIPDGYAIDELPKPKMMLLPGNTARYLYNVAVNGNTIAITSSMLIAKNLFLAEEYPDLREFYAQVVAKQNEQIVLKKK